MLLYKRTLTVLRRQGAGFNTPKNTAIFSYIFRCKYWTTTEHLGSPGCLRATLAEPLVPPAILQHVAPNLLASKAEGVLDQDVEFQSPFTCFRKRLRLMYPDQAGVDRFVEYQHHAALAAGAAMLDYPQNDGAHHHRGGVPR